MTRHRGRRRSAQAQDRQQREIQTDLYHARYEDDFHQRPRLFVNQQPGVEKVVQPENQQTQHQDRHQFMRRFILLGTQDRNDVS